MDEPFIEPDFSQHTTFLDSDLVGQYLCSGSNIQQTLDNFEERQSQIDLAEQIATTFNENAVGVFEAGTGVGKSFAYLVPTILWLAQNKERVVISTGTINLQQQLFEKDIPFAIKFLNKDIKAVLLKGRQHYLCLRRFNDVLGAQELLFADEGDELAKIEQWSQITATGSDSDLPFLPTYTLWQRINSESDNCMGRACKHFSRCFVMKMRKEASEASLLVVNHHLLFADIEMRRSVGYDDYAVLPPFTRLIFDEAHGIEDAASSFFSESLSRYAFLRNLNALYRKRRTVISGYMNILRGLITDDPLIDSSIRAIDEVKKYVNLLDTSCLDFMYDKQSYRLKDDIELDFMQNMQILQKKINTLTTQLEEILDLTDVDDEQKSIVWEVRRIVRRLENLRVFCQKFINQKREENIVYWIEKRINNASGESYPVFMLTPLNIGNLMREGVFLPFSSVVCTSATLTVGNTFEFFKRRIGLENFFEKPLYEKIFLSPFNYKKNMRFAIVKDIPLPHEASFQANMEQTVLELILSANGRSLVLFTAYESLKSACQFCRKELAAYDIHLYQQGSDDRFRLLEAFKKDEKSVLFATDSFWEGVDVPGTSLSQVIIVKLPFSVPTEPVFEARCEALTKMNKNPFMELSLPQSIIRFRQGAGRLLRHSEDRGIVTILDRRIVEKFYGKLFFSYVPEAQKTYESAQYICELITRFLD